jgi:rifampin ADP-ribosylating transferase
MLCTFCPVSGIVPLAPKFVAGPAIRDPGGRGYGRAFWDTTALTTMAREPSFRTPDLGDREGKCRSDNVRPPRWSSQAANEIATVRSLGSVGVVSDGLEPVPFEVYEPGVYLHGTKADLVVGQKLVSGRQSNFEEGRMMNYVYFTATLDAATWGAELASGEGPGRIYVVEPTGEFEDDPNLTDKKFPGNPTQSFRSRDPLRVVGELVDWVGHSPEKLSAMRAGLQRIGSGQIED